MPLPTEVWGQIDEDGNLLILLQPGDVPENNPVGEYIKFRLVAQRARKIVEVAKSVRDDDKPSPGRQFN